MHVPEKVLINLCGRDKRDLKDEEMVSNIPPQPPPRQYTTMQIKLGPATVKHDSKLACLFNES